MEEEKIIQDIIGEYAFLKDSIRLQRARRIFITVPREQFENVFKNLATTRGFTQLATITGIDTGETFSILYHLATENGIVCTLTTQIPRANPEINSIARFFNGAEIYERELVDLLGICVNGLPKGNRYPLPDDWPDNQYPLRKDWRPEGAPVEPGEE
ncbi:MAG: NADH-quinone oxidoreductase subunit C [Spirochaetes bacterium]|nr:MAG: NADH-quinone oxidoreductase subunit C [Spirochaetota bacterium]